MKIKNKSGFTLIEIIITILMISVLAVIALKSYFNSTRTFSFLNATNNIMLHLQNARAYGLNNKQISGQTVQSFGVCLTSNSLVLFADNGNKPLLYEPPDALPQNQCAPSHPPDAQNDTVLATYNFGPQYTLSAYQSKDQLNRTPPIAMGFPILLFYNRGDGGFTLKSNATDVVSKTQNKYIILRLAEGSNLTKYMVVFLVSGLVEEYANLNQL